MSRVYGVTLQPGDKFIYEHRPADEVHTFIKWEGNLLISDREVCDLPPYWRGSVKLVK